MPSGMQVSAPDGNSLRSSPTPELATTPDWAFEIHEHYKHEDEDFVSSLLEKYRDAGHPKFRVRSWLTALEGLESVAGRTTEWCQGRASLLLSYCDDQQRLELLHEAIDHIKAKDERPFLLPAEDEKMYFVVRQLIHRDPDLVFKSFSVKRPVFMIAASQGAVSIVMFALEEIKGLLERAFGTSREALTENLFNRLKVHDRAANTALALAVEEGHADIVNILLNEEERLAGPEYLRDDHIREAVRKCEIEIITKVLNAQPGVAERLPELIVRYGASRYKEMWTAMVPRFENLLNDSDILHLAVQKGKLDIIDWLVDRFPEMVTRKDKLGKIALSYNTDQTAQEKIRTSIVPSIVRQCNLVQIKELLRVANDTRKAREASLDLGVFNQATHDFAHFVKLVKANIRTPSGLNVQPDLASNIKFESVLRYVHFPDMSRKTWEGQKEELQEVPLILRWLRQKEVKSILRLVVPDCRLNPLAEDRICTCLEDFGVVELNWRRLDLGIEPILSLASTLTVLYLYSSGNWAVLSHWVSEGGLQKLEKLKELHIIIVKESMTEHQAERYKKRVTDEIRKLRSKCGWVWFPSVNIENWSHGTKLTQKFDGMESVAGPEEKSASSCIKIDAFVNEYTNIQQARLERGTNSNLKPLRKIKIALIDTGIGALADRSQSWIKPGTSFSHGAGGESESPWWIPSNEHGPQMADIISSIDPYCEIYPVKITDDTDEGAVKARPIIDAIKWAIEQSVDIISLSLVLFNNHKDLYDTVYAASQKNILIICSTADRGNNQQKVYPAQYWMKMKTDCLIPIAGCDQYGKLTDWSTETEAKYHFLGKNVTARSAGLMTSSTKEISGSSVATAIAAGTASLVLACSLLALEEEKYSRKQRIEMFFERMQTEENRRHDLKYVEPAIIFGENSIAGANLETYIKRTFGLGLSD